MKCFPVGFADARDVFFSTRIIPVRRFIVAVLVVGVGLRFLGIVKVGLDLPRHDYLLTLLK